MSLEKLIASLRKETASKEKSIVAEAKEQAAKIMEDAYVKADEIGVRVDILAEALKKRNERLNKSQDKLQWNRSVIRSENAYIEALKSKCKEMFYEYTQSGDYRSFVVRELQKVLLEIPDMKEIRADPITAEAIRESGFTKAEVLIDEAVGEGFVAISEDGKSRIVSTLESRLDKAWQANAVKFMKLISDKVKSEY